MASSEKATENTNTTFTFKKFMGNVATVARINSSQNSNKSMTSIKATKTVSELEGEIEILHLQKSDLRKLLQERTYELDQLKKLDSEHHALQQRWKETEEKSLNDVANIQSYSQDVKKELSQLKQQNAMLQSKQTANDLKKNKLGLKLTEINAENEKNKKIIEQKNKEKKMLVSEVLKLRNQKQELIIVYKGEIDKLNKNNKNNITQLTELHTQKIQSKEMEYLSRINKKEHKIEELRILYRNYSQNIKDKVINIDSTTNAFDAMITNANIGNLDNDECNKILDNIVNSIESMEKENENYHMHNTCNQKSNSYDDTCNENDDEKDNIQNNDEIILNRIESRMLKSLKEKALLQRSTNGLMFQLKQLQNTHEKEIKVKDETIYQHELRAKVKFFKKKQSDT